MRAAAGTALAATPGAAWAGGSHDAITPGARPAIEGKVVGRPGQVGRRGERRRPGVPSRAGVQQAL